MTQPPSGSLDHIGWDLSRAAKLWHGRFQAAMVAAGYGFFAEGRAALIPLIDLDGTPQAALAQRAGMSKQAVQQHLDLLERDGIVARSDPDRTTRRKTVHFTEAGVEMLKAGDIVKARIEAELARELGMANFSALKRGLKQLLETSQAT